MTAIAEITARVESNIKSGQPAFAGTLLDTLAILHALDACVDLRGGFRAVCRPSGESCIVTGTTTVLGIGEVTITCTFQQPDGRLRFDLRAELAGHAALPLPGLPRCAVGNLFLDVNVGGLDSCLQSLQWSAGGTIGTEPSALDVTLRSPLGAEQWRLEARPRPGSPWDLRTAVAQLGAADLAANLPAPLAELDFALSFIEADFDPQAKTMPRLAAQIVSTHPWTIIPSTTSNGLAIKDVRLTLAALDLSFHGNPSFSAALEGSVGTIPIVVQTVETPTHVLVELAPGPGVSLGQLSELGHLLGGDAWPSLLPPGLDALKDLTLSDLQVEVDLSPPAIDRAAVGIELPGRWHFGSIVALRNARLNLEVAQPFSKAPAVSGHFSAWIDLGRTPAFVTGAISQRTLSISATIGRIDLTELAAQLLGDLPFTLPRGTAIENANVTYSSGAGLTIEADTSIDLFELARAVGIPLPAGLQTFALKAIAFEESPGAISLTVRGDAEVHFPHGSDQGATVSDFAVTVRRSTGGAPTIAASFVIDLTVELSPDFRMEVAGSGPSTGLRCSWDGETKDWSVQGSVTGTLFGVPLPTLAAGFSRDGKGTCLTLRCDGPVSLVPGGWAAVASLDMTGFELSVKRDGTSDACDWVLAAKSRFAIGSFFEGEGKVSGGKNQKGWSVAASAVGPWTVQVPVGSISTGVTVGSVTFQAGSGPTAAAIEADDVRLTVKGLPSPIDRCLPSELVGTLRCDQTGVSLTFSMAGPRDGGEPAGQGFAIPFPTLRLPLPDGTVRSLGQPSVDLTAVVMHLGSSSDLAVDLKVGVPRELNELFGKGTGGRKLLKDGFALRLAIGASGLVFRFAESPFNDLQFYVPETHPGQQWFDWSLEGCGRFSVRVPEFSLEEKSFVARGGIERHGGVKVPLGWLKAMLGEAALVGELAGRGVPDGLVDTLRAAIPDGISLDTLDLDHLLEALKTFLGSDPDLRPLVDVVDKIEEAEHRLPTRLRGYLGAPLPDSMVLDISVDVTGGFSFSFSCDGAPLRVLVPGAAGLTGLTIRQLSLGLSLGGTVVRADVDAELDVYDYLTLAVAVATDTGRDFVSHLTVGKSLWFAPTAFPVPIPIFYDPIKWEYKGLLGEASTEWALPAPHPTLGDLIHMLSSLYQFATVKDQVLDPGFIPENCKVELELGVNHLVLPDFLGGGTLSLNEQRRTLSISGGLAPLLNAFKFLNPAYVIQAIPLKADGRFLRVGATKVDFGPLHLDAAWCVTTEREYREQVLVDPDARALLAVSHPESLLDVLSSDGPALDRGFVIFLMGHADIAGFMGWDVRIGSASTDRGLEARVGLTGRLGVFESLIEGHVRAAKPQGPGASRPIGIDGHATLSMGSLMLIDGSASVEVVAGERFAAKVTLSLSSCFTVEGTWTISKTEMTLRGRAVWHGQLLNQDALLQISGERVHAHFDAELYGVGATFDVTLSSRAELKATLGLQLPVLGGDLFTGNADLSAERVEFEGALRVFPDDFPAKLRGSTHGSGSATGLAFRGDLEAHLGFITLGGDIGLDLAHDHLVIHGRWRSGEDIRLTLQAQPNGRLTGDFGASFGPAAVTVGADILPGTSVALTFRTGVTPMAMTARFDGRAAQAFHTSSSFDLTFAGLPLTSGTIEWTNDAFALSGGVNFGLWSTVLTGGLDETGLHLRGSYEAGLHLPYPVGLLGFSVTVSIDQRHAGVALALPAGWSGEGDIAVFRGRLCTLVQLTKDVWLTNVSVWIEIPLGGLPTFYLWRPGDWPA